MMATLYIQEQGSLVRKRDQQIVVTKEGQTLETIPLNKIDQVVVMGRGVQLSTALLVDLIGRGIPVMLTNQRGSRHYATLSAGPSRFGALRLQQMQRVGDPEWSRILAQAVIHAKLHNQQAFLAQTGWPGAATAQPQIAVARQALESASNIDQVRGYEGAAAAAYFGAWRTTFQAAWGFGGRDFYPPPDPINAMLSFGYTLLLHDVLTAVQFTGLDPYLGCFHVVEAGRPALALDLMEEFRPLIVDRLVWELLRTGAVDRTRFERPAHNPAAVYLDADGRTLLVNRYEALMQTVVPLANGTRTPFRRVVLLQAQAVARVVRGEQTTYVGYMP
jgi:CRISPR-associated protein Cas1